MRDQSKSSIFVPGLATVLAATALMLSSGSLFAVWTSADESVEVQGFIDNSTYTRGGTQDGISKMRTRSQIEIAKEFEGSDVVSEFSLHSIFRVSYDAAYDINDNTWGDKSGGFVMLQSLGGPADGLPASVPWGAGANPYVSPVVLPGTNPYVSNTSPYLNGFFTGPNGGSNPNEGLVILNSELFTSSGGIPGFGGIQLAYPSRPCNVDPRGCIEGYMDADLNELRYPEFNDR